MPGGPAEQPSLLACEQLLGCSAGSRQKFCRVSCSQAVCPSLPSAAEQVGMAPLGNPVLQQCVCLPGRTQQPLAGCGRLAVLSLLASTAWAAGAGHTSTCHWAGQKVSGTLGQHKGSRQLSCWQGSNEGWAGLMRAACPLLMPWRQGEPPQWVLNSCWASGCELG